MQIKSTQLVGKGSLILFTCESGVLATINSIAGSTRGQQASVIFSGYHRVQITSIDKIEGAKIIANIKKLDVGNIPIT